MTLSAGSYIHVDKYKLHNIHVTGEILHVHVHVKLQVQIMYAYNSSQGIDTVMRDYGT